MGWSAHRGRPTRREHWLRGFVGIEDRALDEGPHPPTLRPGQHIASEVRRAGPQQAARQRHSRAVDWAPESHRVDRGVDQAVDLVERPSSTPAISKGVAQSRSSAVGTRRPSTRCPIRWWRSSSTVVVHERDGVRVLLVPPREGVTLHPSSRASAQRPGQVRRGRSARRCRGTLATRGPGSRDEPSRHLSTPRSGFRVPRVARDSDEMVFELHNATERHPLPPPDLPRCSSRRSVGTLSTIWNSRASHAPRSRSFNQSSHVALSGTCGTGAVHAPRAQERRSAISLVQGGPRRSQESQDFGPGLDPLHVDHAGYTLREQAVDLRERGPVFQVPPHERGSRFQHHRAAVARARHDQGVAEGPGRDGRCGSRECSRGFPTRRLGHAITARRSRAHPPSGGTDGRPEAGAVPGNLASMADGAGGSGSRRGPSRSVRSRSSFTTATAEDRRDGRGAVR